VFQSGLLPAPNGAAAEQHSSKLSAVKMVIFCLDNTYMYAVVNKMVKYPSGNTIITNHKKTWTAKLSSRL
jgi:hypothetical protein